MKSKKILTIALTLMLSFSVLVGCDKDNNPLSEKMMGDNSALMPKVEMSANEFKVDVVQKITPLVQDTYFLKTQAISIKNGGADRTLEIPKIEDMILVTQDTREYISGLLVMDEKKSAQTELLNSLDRYSIELNDYKNLLSNQSVTTDELQNKIDVVISALNDVKQYAN